MGSIPIYLRHMSPMHSAECKGTGIRDKYIEKRFLLAPFLHKALFVYILNKRMRIEGWYYEPG